MSVDSTTEDAPKKRPSRVPPFEPICVTIRQAMELTGVSHSTIYVLIRDGKLTTTKVGGRTLVYFSSIKELLGV